MRDVGQYFELIEKTIEHSPVVSAEVEIERRDATRGTIEGVVYFADGSRLEFSERIVIEQRRPVKREYRYQYVGRNQALLRYDNAPHHPHIATFPHHKHVGTRILPAAEPTFRQVLDEALGLIAETANPPTTKKRRRPRHKSKSH